MAATTEPGRHRAPGRHNPLTELTGMVSRAGESGVKASAVLAASGGLVAAFALPAQATPTTTSAGSAAKVSTQAKPATLAAAPAVVAPQAAAPIALVTAGVVGVEAVEKPAPPPPPPPPPPAPVAQTRRQATTTASRSATRTSPTVNVPQNVAAGGVLAVAEAYSGIYYRYGGTTPAGFDCSGFTQFVFAQVGINIPRTATAQAQATRRVSDPQPGDLVFVGSPSYASHVGIYAGNGMMYDSPRTGKTTGLHKIWSTNIFYGRV